MTTTAPPVACPACAAPLTGAAACTSCALPLTGPDAVRLWEVDVELARLEAARGPLLAERRALLARLRGLAPAAAAAPVPAPVAVPRQEWTPRRVQNLLLALGGLLLAVAATVFAAVTYDRLGAGGRAAVLLALTALAAAAAPRLQARGLAATGETVAAVALALAALDAWGLRRLGVGAGLDGLTFAATACAVLAGLSAAHAGTTRLRLPRAAAVGLGTASLVLAVTAAGPGTATTAAALLAGVAALDLALVAALRTGPATELVRDVRRAGAVAAAVTAVLAALTTAVAVPLDGPRAAVAVGALALLAGGAAAAATGGARAVLAGGATVLAAAAAVVALAEDVADASLPVVGATAAAVLAAACAALPRSERRGPVAGALLAASAGVLAVAPHVAAGLLGPAAWLTDPWSFAATGARDALAPHRAWEGSPAVVATLLAAALTAAVAAHGRWGAGLRRTGAGAAGLALVAAVLVPVTADLPHPASLLVLLALAAGLVAAGEVRGALRAGALLPAGVAVVWSLADTGTTLAVLPVAALLAAAVAVRTAGAGAAALAAALLGAEVAAAGAARDLAPERLGGLLLLAPAALLLAGTALRGAVRDAVHAVAAVLVGTAVLLATGDAGWLSWTLVGGGVLALAASLSADRRVLAPVGALLLAASSWVRLADAGVGAPEPYVLPVAALALVLGHLRLRRDAAVRSQAAYGPGLALLLGPSALAALGEDGLARPLLLGAAALGVLLVGARTRLQAPLVAGGAALAVVALDLLAPYAAAVPRWTALAAAGTLLVVVGATFEQRRRELAGLRERVAALR
ncbi:MAG TPA: hypothetical protein VNU66_10740 [Mycobacteriales bacterium]|nr:hypothetical protein [Mycobacteriales bacterium]